MDTTDATPDAVAALWELEAIRQLKYRYLRGLDQKRWELVEACFTPDATASYGGGAYELEGRDEILSFLRGSMGRRDLLSSHRCSHPEIRLTGPDSAIGTWALDDTVIVGEHDVLIHGAAFYEDTYIRDDDQGWRIRHTGYQRTFEQLVPRASIDGIALTASWWGTDGRSQLPAP